MAAVFNNILIVRTDAIGDLILSEPVAQVIKSQYPKCRISFLVSDYSAPVLHNNKNVDEVISMPRQYFKFNTTNLFKITRILKSNNYDAVVVLRPTLFNAIAVYLSNIPVRIGTGYRLYSVLFNKRKYEHRSDNTKNEMYYNLSLLENLGISDEEIPEDIKPEISIIDNEIESSRMMLLEKGIKGNDIPIIIHPGGRDSAPKWPLDKYIELIGKLSELPGVKVILTGTDDEFNSEEMKKLEAHRKIYINLIGKLDLRRFMSLISVARLTVTNSTGTAHIAAALGVPLVAIYQDSSDISLLRWTPVGIAGKMSILYSEDVESITTDKVYSSCRGFLEN
ncbi:MAG: glycosyltransferase family 9 protein [candidate division Zixibacteria bacterium]|nr:glycosyltransferase family 9 protein [candidate division Zixibacteria bacterium]